MRPTKSSQLPSNLLFFDTETKGVKDKTDHSANRQYFWFGHATAFRYERGQRTRQKTLSFRTIKEFWEFVESRLDSSRPLYCFAHNIAFDLTITDFWRVSEELGMEPEFAILEGPPTAIGLHWQGCKLIMIDTLNYWRIPLKMLGDSLHLPKLEMPTGSKINQTWIDYCERDVEVIALSVEGLLDYIKEHDLGKFGLTAASQAMNAYKRRFMKHEIFVHDDIRVLALERDSYYGGLVHCFYLGEVKRKTLYHYDVNSLYPSVMLNKFPVKLIERSRDMTPARLLSRMRTKGAVARVKLAVDDDVYPYRTEGRLIEARGEFTTTLCGPELERALSNRVVKSVEYAAIYDMAHIFTDYVNFFWEQRKEYKRKENKVGDLFTKLMMNSLYGKFGQKAFDWQPLDMEHLKAHYKRCGVPLPKEYKDDSALRSFTFGQKSWVPLGLEDPLKVRYWNGLLQFRVDDGEHHESCPIIAAYVTAYGRELLRSYIRCAGPKEVYYCDTDSLFVSKRGKSNLERCGYVDPGRLGLLKLEGESNGAIFFAPKDYVFGDKVVMKGIRANAIEIGEGEYLQDQFEGLPSILKRSPEPYVAIKWITKKQSRVYRKGTKTPSGWVDYLTIIDEELET